MSRRYPIDTRVMIDGIEAYDRASHLAEGQPTVLDGLSLTWGRSSAVDQPDVGECSFVMREQLQDPIPERVLEVNLAPDPSFEYGVGGFAGGGDGTVERDTTRARTGVRSLKITTGAGTYNPQTQIYGPGSPLQPGDTITARGWVWVPDLLPALPVWNGFRGTLAVIPAHPADTPQDTDQILEWTATEDQTNNAALISSTETPVFPDDQLTASVWFRKGNTQAPDRIRMQILCYNDTGYLGVATLPGVDNQQIPITEDWTHLDVPTINLQPGTTGVSLATYAAVVGQDNYQSGDKIQVAAPTLLPAGTRRPLIRVGGAGVTGANSADFAGPYRTWAPIEVTASVHTAGATALVYVFGFDRSGHPVWLDDLSVTVNADPVDFSGDTPSDNPGTIIPSFHTLAGIDQLDRYEAWPALYETPSGAWLLTYKSGGSHMPNTPARAIIVRSTDEGNSWQPVASFGDEGVNVGGGPVAVAGDGSLTVITTWNTSGAQGENDEFIMYRSEDDGLSWTEQVRYPWPEVATFGRPLTLANGDLLASWHGQGWGMIRSSDNGRSWAIASTTNGGPWAGEARMVQAPDGTLIMTGRNNRFDLFYSTDNGHSWTRGVNTGITPEPPAGTNNTFTHAMAIWQHWIELVWISRADQKVYYTYGEIAKVLHDPTAWHPSVGVGQLNAGGPGDLGYPSMLHRNNGALYLAWYADPSEDHTPAIFTGILRLHQTPGEGVQYRWAGIAGQSPSERFMPVQTQTPIRDAIHAGSTVAVWAKAGDPVPDDDQVMTETQFRDLGPLARDQWNTDSPGLNVEVWSRFGRQAAWISSGTSPWAAQVVFPPAPYPDEGRDFDAWDDIPRLLPDKSWQLTITALLPPSAGAQLTAWAVTDPHRTATPTVCIITGDQINQIGQIPGDHQWHTVTAMVSLPPGADASWILPGLQYTVMPSPTSWATMPDTWLDHDRSWSDWSRAGISEIRLQQTASSARDVLVWSGQVTTVTAKPAGDHAVQIDVGAADPSAPLANESVGEQPWPVQSVATRFGRILRLSRLNTPTTTLDPGVTSYQLTARDVDAQPVLGLLQDVATSAGAVLWVGEHATTGTYLWLEDPTTRAATRAFHIDPFTGAVTITGSAAGVTLLSAADILRDPLSLTQDTTSVITSVDVGWQEQTTDDDGEPSSEGRTVTRNDDTAIDRYGLQKLSIDTELINEADAADLADRHLARARGSEWQFTGVSIDGRTLERSIDGIDDQTRISSMLDLLDGTRRLGRPITLLDLPDWMQPADVSSGYLEGGAYTLNDGRWDAELTIAPAAAEGQSATWEQMPTEIVWADMHPTITWADAYGVVAPTSTPEPAEELV